LWQYAFEIHADRGLNNFIARKAAKPQSETFLCDFAALRAFLFAQC
jgi:hypothetical protein